MTKKSCFTPHHLNATPHDLEGNRGIGRYILLPGSDGRAKEIADHFSNITVKTHPRGHHLYLGTIQGPSHAIEVATLSSGMGCPSMEIILHELFQLGAKRFLRIGTSGSLQPDLVKLGQLVNVIAAVRDEDTTSHYVSREVPAIASPEYTSAILHAATKLNCQRSLHSGTVHCKSSFYAREFGAGPMAEANNAYLKHLSDYGILASEMETAALFIQSQWYHHQQRLKGYGPEFRVLAGAVLAVLCIPPDEFLEPDQSADVIEHLIELALETTILLAEGELTAAGTYIKAKIKGS